MPCAQHATPTHVTFKNVNPENTHEREPERERDREQRRQWNMSKTESCVERKGEETEGKTRVVEVGIS